MKRTDPIRRLPRGSIVVIGAGAAGMMAAIAAARKLPPGSVYLLERNRAVGEKLLITGGGRCNLTHGGSVAELLEEGFLRPAERRFLRPSIHAYPPSELLGLLASGGVAVSARPDGKIFPESGSARTVVDAFRRLLAASGVVLEQPIRVLGASRHGERFLVGSESGGVECDRLIIATGGVSWPATGSTGDGLALAAALGHRIVPASAALAPIHTDPLPAEGLAGIALRGVELIASAGGKKVVRRGDVLFTHKGLSGPAALSLSRDAAELRARGGRVRLSIDFLPGMERRELEEALLLHARRRGAQLVRKFLQACPMGACGALENSGALPTIPTALVPLLMERAAIFHELTWAKLGKRERQKLLDALKSLEAGTIRSIPLRVGEVTAGGAALAEVDPGSMGSRIVPGLYLCGELLDYAGEIGGYNLQAAFSTGWIAGTHAADSLKSQP